MTIWELFCLVAVSYGLIELTLVKRGVIQGIPDEEKKNEPIL